MTVNDARIEHAFDDIVPRLPLAGLVFLAAVIVTTGLRLLAHRVAPLKPPAWSA